MNVYSLEHRYDAVSILLYCYAITIIAYIA